MAKSPESTTIAGGVAILMVIAVIVLIVGMAYLRAMQGG